MPNIVVNPSKLDTEYEFQPLLEYKKDGSGPTGPMSPVMAANYMAKNVFKAKYQGLCRVYNNQSSMSGYDHLLMKLHCKDKDPIVALFIDFGTGYCPVCIYDSNDESISVAPIYLKETTTERMNHHRWNTETADYPNENPIMVLTEDQMIQVCKEALLSEAFEINKHNSH